MKSRGNGELNFTEQTLPLIEEIAEQIPGGFFIYYAEVPGKLLYLNRATLRIFGCRTREEFRALTGDTFRGMVHPDDLEATEQSIAAQIAGSRDDDLDYVEYRIRRRDGGIRWVDDYGHLVHTEDFGDVYYVFISDVTARHYEREEGRRKAEVIEGLSIDFDSIYLLNLDTGSMRPYRLRNEYFREIADGIAGRPVRDAARESAGDAFAGDAENSADWRSILPLYAERYVLPEDSALYLKEISEERIRERLESENSYTVDYRCRGEGREPVYMQMSVVRIDDESDHLHVVMGYRDVTEQTLRIRQETADRLKMEMQLERERQTHEAKSAFLFNISHDIRTPMNAIMGFTSLARSHMDDPERLKDYLDKVNASNHHMLALIDDLLEMGQIDAGRVQIKTEICDLEEQLEMVLHIMEAQAEAKQLSLERDLKLPKTKVCLDALRFRRIMANLIGNAVKFTPEHGTVQVSAQAGNVSESGFVRYEFEIADTGIGMTEEFMRHMFEAFEREDTSTKTGYAGAGLGLSIVKSLLDIMGGSISVQSKKGEGSTFTVSLPMKLADYAADAGAKHADGADAHMVKASGEKRILLVEDIEINRMLAETILDDAGFLVESVGDGCDAVEAISAHPLWYYDLVLMDIQMPVMNGYEAARAIRALGREDTDQLPIIALSANAREEDKRESFASGMNQHIAKPFDIANLIDTVNEQIASQEDENAGEGGGD